MFQTKPQNSQQYKLEHPMLTNDVNDLKKILQTDLESGGKTRINFYYMFIFVIFTKIF